MSTPRFARGTKGRLFVYLGIVVFIGVVIYFFQLQLQELQQKSDKCQQQQESLSAQLQVIFEYKLRLEKSLQQDKADHRQMREELQARVEEEKQLREKENLESINKYTSLQQQYKLLQSQHEDLTDECNKLRVTQLQGLEERSKLESAVQAVQQELEQFHIAKEKEMESLKSQFLRLEVENDRLEKQNKELASHTQDFTSRANHLEKENIQLKNEITELKKSLKSCQIDLNGPAELKTVKVAESPATREKSKVQSIPSPSSSPVAVIPEEINLRVLQEPSKQGASEKVSQSMQKSTTPQINPDAVLSHEKTANVVPVPPPQEQADKQPLDSPVGARPSAKENDGEQAAKDSPHDANGEGAMAAPQWENAANVIPNQPPFNAQHGLIESINNWNKSPQLRFNIPAGVVPAPRGYGLNNAENVVHPPEDENAANNVGNEANGWPWRYKHWAGGPQPVAQMHNNIRLGGDEDNEVGDNPLNQRNDDLGLQREKYNNNRANGQDVQRRRQLAEPRRNAAGIREDNRVGGEEDKEIPRQVHNPYEYNAEYEKDHQRGDLQLEEGEEDGKQARHIA
ncbi:Golgi integral membrane protein 4 isoform X2 [Anabrus simplex]|uniref:Golgi integral membrane protein 4 isoform X2 n=1 Tax=Anabrus simplex TaxID=316456 RepID=UPI0035A37279